MADHTQTITNTINTFGPSAANQWGNMVWNDEWGASEDIGTHTEKGFFPPLAIGELYPKDFVREPVTNAITLTDVLSAILKSFGEWDYVFPGPTTDATQQVFDQFTKVAAGTDTFSKVSTPASTMTKV